MQCPDEHRNGLQQPVPLQFSANGRCYPGNSGLIDGAGGEARGTPNPLMRKVRVSAADRVFGKDRVNRANTG